MRKQIWPETPITELQAPKRWALNGGPFGSKLVSRDYVEAGVPVIRGTNLPNDKRFSYDDFVFVSEAKADELLAHNAHPGDVVFTQRGTLGQVGIIPKHSPHERFVISQSQMKISVDKSRVDPYWLFYCFRNPTTQQAMINRASSSGVPHINLSVLRDFKVKLPPLAEQGRIASILCSYDELIENNARRIAVLEEMAQRIYDEWLVFFRFPGHANVRMVESDLGIVPQGWAVKVLDTVVEAIIDYRGKTPAKLDGEWAPDGVPALSALNVKGGKLVNLDKAKCVGEELYRRWMKTPLRKGDILMTSEAPLGELHLLSTSHRYCLSQRLFGIRSDPAIISPTILYLTLAAPRAQFELASRATGATVSGIRQAELRKIRILIPPKDVQQKIEPALAGAMSLISTLEQANHNLRTTRDLLLPKLFSGELDVSALPEQEVIAA